MALAPRGTLFAEPRNKPTSPTGAFQPGCYRNFYLTGTTTYANVYADGALSTPLPQPVTAASDGRFPPIYMDTNIAYRCQLYNSGGTIQEDVDPYVPPGQVNTFTVPITVTPQADGNTITVTPFGPTSAGLNINAVDTTYRSMVVFEQGSVLTQMIGTNKGTTGDLITGAQGSSMIIRSVNDINFSTDGGASQSLVIGSSTGSFALRSKPATSTGLIDFTPDGSTASTVTVTGITAVTTATIRWFRIGNLLVVNLPNSLNGTSSATTFTLTGLPQGITLAETGPVISPVAAGWCTDNGSVNNTVSVGLSSTINLNNSYTTKLTFYLNGNAAGWTASGTKGFASRGATFHFYII